MRNEHRERSSYVAWLGLFLPFGPGCATDRSARAVAAPPIDADAPAPRLIPVESEPLSFFIGEWDVQVLGPDGSLAYRAHTHARPILDGHALQDDWRAFDAAGNVVFRGTTLRATGHGVDPQGEFLERLAYFDLEEGSYSLFIERSYDGGETYRPTTNLVPTRRRS